VAGGLYIVRVYLSDQNVQPTKATWAPALEAKVGQMPYPAVYPDELTLADTSAAGAPVDTWSAGGRTHRIRIPHARPESEAWQLTHMVLFPSQADPGSASGTVTITGKWTC